MTIDEKIQLLKDSVKLLHPELTEVFFDCHDEDGFTVIIKSGDDDTLLEGAPEPKLEKAVETALAQIEADVLSRLRQSSDIAKRLEFYKNPVVVMEAPPEKEGKKK